MAKTCKDCLQPNPFPMNRRCPQCTFAWLDSDEGKAKIAKLAEQSKKRREKRERKRLKDRKEGLRPISEWLRLAQGEFNRFIRLRDHYQPCISCGCVQAPQWAAGHYRTVGGGSGASTRFDEDNVHKQCNKHCNMSMSGNIVEYRKGLIERIGLERLEILEGPHPAKNYTIEDIKKIRQDYRIKANLLKAKIDMEA